ncbi:abortive infection family protein, partial [Xanthomonas campestris]
ASGDSSIHPARRRSCDRRLMVRANQELLCSQHPKLRELGSQSDTLERVLRCLSSVIDCLNPARNNASLAHANETLLEKDEATLAINAARTVFQYLDTKFC